MRCAWKLWCMGLWNLEINRTFDHSEEAWGKTFTSFSVLVHYHLLKLSCCYTKAYWGQWLLLKRSIMYVKLDSHKKHAFMCPLFIEQASFEHMIGQILQWWIVLCCEHFVTNDDEEAFGMTRESWVNQHEDFIGRSTRWIAGPKIYDLAVIMAVLLSQSLYCQVSFLSVDKGWLYVI